MARLFYYYTGGWGGVGCVTFVLACLVTGIDC